jgi:hypothetical protein
MTRTMLLLMALLVPAAASAETCLIVDDENSPAVTVSGRITMQNYVRKDGDLRSAAGPFLVLDKPLYSSTGADCVMRDKIAINSEEKFRVGEKVLLEGKLTRYQSALIYPGIFLDIGRRVK